MRAINKIILHHSASDIVYHDDIEVVRQWHLDRGFNDIGYHFFIRKFTRGIQIGRPIRKAGAHTRGLNDYSIGICLSGKNDFFDNQFYELYGLLVNLMDQFDLCLDDVVGHREVSDATTCPHYNIEQFKQDYF